MLLPLSSFRSNVSGPSFINYLTVTGNLYETKYFAIESKQ